MNMKSIIYRRSKLFKKGIYPARDLVVIKSMYMGETLKKMDFDRFHIIYVLDDNLKIIKIFTEQELFNFLIENDKDITFGEFLDE